MSFLEDVCILNKKKKQIILYMKTKLIDARACWMLE